jgi:hypothetical protein
VRPHIPSLDFVRLASHKIPQFFVAGVWKVRLCASCLAASVVNKTDAMRVFLLSEKDLKTNSAQVPTWLSGVMTPFGVPVQMYFRRHLERLAAEKYGANGLKSALDRKARVRAETQAKAEGLRAEALAAVTSALAANGLTIYSAEWSQLGEAARAIAIFLSGGAHKPSKREKATAATAAALTSALLEVGEAPPEEQAPRLIIKSVKDCERALLPALAQRKRRIVLQETCDIAGVSEADSPAVFGSFVHSSDAAVLRALDAKHAAAAASAAAASAAVSVRKTSKSKKKGYASSDESDRIVEEDEPSDADHDEPMEDTIGEDDTAAVAAEARACALAMVSQRRIKKAELAELQAELALLALQHSCADIACEQFLLRAPAYRSFCAELDKSMGKRARDEMPHDLAAAAPPAKRGGSGVARKGAAAAAASPPVSRAAQTAQAIAGPLIGRIVKLDTALADELNEILIDMRLTHKRAGTLLGCGAGESPWSRLSINGVLYRTAYIEQGVLHEKGILIGGKRPYEDRIIKASGADALLHSLGADSATLYSLRSDAG